MSDVWGTVHRLEREKATGGDPDSLRREVARLTAEVVRLQELLRGEGANRYWEGRCRDEEAENERLRAALSGMVAEFNDYHYNTCPAEKGGECECFAGALLAHALKALNQQKTLRADVAAMDP